MGSELKPTQGEKFVSAFCITAVFPRRRLKNAAARAMIKAMIVNLYAEVSMLNL